MRYSVLIPNMKGLDAALSAPRAEWPDEIGVFAAATEVFSQKNINCSIAESIERFRPVVAAAHAHGIKVRGAVSCAVGCPYQGEVSADEVERVVRLLKEIGVDQCGICDTIGVGTPKRVQAALERALRHYAIGDVGGHFHDTYGQAIGNVYASLEVGIFNFDASVAGLGGCPYAKGATGNVATEDVLFLLDGLGIDTGISIDGLVDAAAFISAAARQEAGLAGGQRALGEASVSVEKLWGRAWLHLRPPGWAWTSSRRSRRCAGSPSPTTGEGALRSRNVSASRPRTRKPCAPICRAAAGSPNLFSLSPR